MRSATCSAPYELAEFSSELSMGRKSSREAAELKRLVKRRVRQVQKVEQNFIEVSKELSISL